jgi:crotonobetainyl-CoA:carnitine CoA-transferase CaiB-like acyl-CoA transferase
MVQLHTFLAGMKVLDLSQYIPGPMASLFLADMGAEVLKIEPPRGDEMRNLGPRDGDDHPIFYRSLNAGKSVRRMDLKDPAIREEFLSLALECDVLIEGFRPGVMQRLGLDYETLSEINPRLIYCSISGYGAIGGRANQAAHDGNYLAVSGILDRNGTEEPFFFDPPVSDTSGALFAVVAILGALHGRSATARGCHLDIGLADVTMPLQMLQVAAWGAIGEVPVRRGTYLNGGAAYYQVYRTGDNRHIMLGAVETKFWSNFCLAAGHPGWVERHGEPIPQHDLIEEVSAYFRSLDLKQANSLFTSNDCCFSPVLDLGEALSDQQIYDRGLVLRSDNGELQALFPAHVNGKPPASRRPLSELKEGASARPTQADVETTRR